MLPSEFAAAILALRDQHRFSVTSWGRTAARNASLGGKEDSRHLLWLAVDAVLDSGEDKQAFFADIRAAGLHYIDEGDHIHIQDRGVRPDPPKSPSGAGGT